MQKRELGELDLLDDFLLGAMVSHPELGEKFSRKLLTVILGRNIGKLKVIPQKVLYGMNTGFRGARLDVYAEETDEPELSENAKAPDTQTAAEETGANTASDKLVISDAGTVYDIEPDKNGSKKARKALPKRVRFYHAKIDGASLKSGKGFENLKRVVVIFITPYDPFDRNRMRYTITTSCKEEPEMPYDDGAVTVFLYTKGTVGNPPEELRQLLQYMEHTTRENAVNETLQDMQQMVDTVKRDGEVSLEYMKELERAQMYYNEGREEEMKNTARERARAEAAEQKTIAAEQKAITAEQKAITMEQEILLLKEKLRKYEEQGS